MNAVLQRRVMMNFLAFVSAILAALLACGYLISVRIEFKGTALSTAYSGEVGLQNGCLIVGEDHYPFFGSGNLFDFQFRPDLARPEYLIWWDWRSFARPQRIGGMGRRTEFFIPLWCLLIPVAGFPLIFFGRRLRNPSGGFPVIQSAKQG